MRTLLTFAGSLVHFTIMTIIWPLVLAVYAGLQFVHLYQYISQYKAAFVRPFTNVSLSRWQLPFRKQFHLVWEKALRFHL